MNKPFPIQAREDLEYITAQVFSDAFAKHQAISINKPVLIDKPYYFRGNGIDHTIITFKP